MMNELTHRYVRIAILLLSAIAFGCAATAEQQDLIPCTEPRPEVCTMDYTPVCGKKRLSGYERWKTYSNACTACSDISVDGYREGACEAGTE